MSSSSCMAMQTYLPPTARKGQHSAHSTLKLSFSTGVGKGERISPLVALLRCTPDQRQFTFNVFKPTPKEFDDVLSWEMITERV